MTGFAIEKGDQIYQITCFDEGGNRLPRIGNFVIEDDVEREIHFMEHAEQAGAAAYSVHLLPPKEVARIVRDCKRQALWDEITGSSLRMIGLDRMNTVEALGQMPLMHYMGAKRG